MSPTPDHRKSKRRRAVLSAVLPAAVLGALTLVAAASLPSSALAQEWPSRPLRLVVPYPPGGAVDQVARLITPKLEAALGQPVVVDNKAGAGGLIGSDLVAKAAPDGYTILFATVSSHAIAPAVYAKMPYDRWLISRRSRTWR